MARGGGKGRAASGSAAAAVKAGADLGGRKLGPYTLVRHLDSGGMAEIFLATRDSLGGFKKSLVLKTLQARFEDDDRVVGMFLDEARLAARLNHPSIVDVFDVGSEDGTHYIAMEHIEGKTLSDLVRRGIEVGKPLPLAYAVYILAQVADGIAYMYDGREAGGVDRFGIVHRDISPSNLIIGARGQTKIIDFGIATDNAAKKDEDTGRPGKYSYMSPEQVRGDGLDGRSDVYSLGIILYEITVGKRLYRGPIETVMKKIVEERVRPPTFVRRDYPAALELVVMRALEKRPADRYGSADELARDLELWLAEQGAHITNRHIADYLADVLSPAAEVSERGIRRAQAFLDTDDEIEDEELDLDAGGGSALWRLAAPAKGEGERSAAPPARPSAPMPVVREAPPEPQPAPAAPSAPPVVKPPEPAVAPVAAAPPAPRGLAGPAALFLALGLAVGAVATFLALGR